MSIFRVSMITLYTFLVSVALILSTFAWSLVTNQFFGMRFTNSPAWFDIGIQWFILVVAIVGALASILSCWSLAHHKRWTPSFVNTFAWLMLFFYPGRSLFNYLGAITMTKVRGSFFFIFDFKTILLTVFSIAALAILRSKLFHIHYASPVLLKSNAP